MGHNCAILRAKVVAIKSIVYVVTKYPLVKINEKKEQNETIIILENI